MNELPLMLADGLDGIVQIIFIVLIIIGALAGQLKGSAIFKQDPKRRGQPPGGDGLQGGQPAIDQATMERKLGREIDRFLGGRTPETQRRVVVSSWSGDDDVDEFEPDVVEAEAVPAAGVASHVERHLDASGFNQRAANLGERIGRSDETVEDRLHKAFDHKLGELTDSSTPGPGPGSAVAEGTDAAIWGTDSVSPSARAAVPDVTVETIADTLRHPEQIRQAIILGEILDRPTQRWE